MNSPYPVTASGGTAGPAADEVVQGGQRAALSEELRHGGLQARLDGGRKLNS